MRTKHLWVALLVACQAQTTPTIESNPPTKKETATPAQSVPTSGSATQAVKSEALPGLPKGFEEGLTKIVQPVLDDEWGMSIIVGVVTEKETRVYPFGKLSATNPKAPDEHTLYEIGSLTKAFTATILSEMVLQKEVALNDPIQKYLPPEIIAPKRMSNDITLWELATHTSGFPAVPDNFWPKEAGNIYDPNFAGKGWSTYTEEKLYAFLQDPSPIIFPFKRYLYSNLGMGLLGHLLSKKSGKSYEQLLIDAVLTPLQMNETRITLSEEQQRHLSPGHDADNVPTNPWMSSSIDGAFAIRSSVHDLLLFMKANLGLIESPLYPAMQAAHQEHFKRVDVGLLQGLGWNINLNGVIFHSGTTGGYRSSFFFMPKQKVGVVVLTNSLIGGSTDGRAALFELMSVNILNSIFEIPNGPTSFPKVSALTYQAAHYEGQYGESKESAKNLNITLSPEGNLLATLPGRTANRLYPEGENIFFMKAYDARLVFTMGADGKATSVEATIGGAKTSSTKQRTK